jgi:predicted nuclease of restriction endonuclease-like (RecB) superfamily
MINSENSKLQEENKRLQDENTKLKEEIINLTKSLKFSDIKNKDLQKDLEDKLNICLFHKSLLLDEVNDIKEIIKPSSDKRRKISVN